MGLYERSLGHWEVNLEDNCELVSIFLCFLVYDISGLLHVGFLLGCAAIQEAEYNRTAQVWTETFRTMN